MHPLWNEGELQLDPKLVYAMSVLPGTIKGPYCHTQRRTVLTLMRGKVALVYKQHEREEFLDALIDADEVPHRIDIPPFWDHAIVGLPSKESFFVSLGDRPYIPGEQERLLADFSAYDFSKWLPRHS